MPQQSRTMYQLDTRTEAERDADINEWVKAHSTDYRKQKQAASGMPPEDPSKGHGTGDHRPKDGKGWPLVPVWHTWVWTLVAFTIGFWASWLMHP